MGQCHQVFLIADSFLIPTPGLWCYGHLPLSGSRRFLNLLKNPDNAEILRDELRRAQEKYGRQGEAPHVQPLGFPYAHYLLAQARNTDLDNPNYAYASGVGLENTVVSPDEVCFDYDNDDGITVIDVTDPTNPAFCHVIEDEPFTPEQYVRRYYPVPSKERMTVLEDDPDEGIRLLSRDVLAEVWPEEFPGGKTLQEEVLVEEPTPRAAALPPLADLTIGPSVDQCLLQNDWSGLEPFFEMPDKAERIKEALFFKDPFPDAGITPLTKMLPHELKKNNAVKLNGQQSLVPKLIVDLVTTFPNIPCIDLLDTNITDEQLLEICSKQPEALYKFHTIVHPALLVLVPTKPNLPVPPWFFLAFPPCLPCIILPPPSTRPLKTTDTGSIAQYLVFR
ncbi:hypothetical protein Moror_5923 [Moniliophthora roreri MCA 2997]|uniref:Uncharacterized protein n=1 Tax=Moniliophthora roreri (strain MCA 2997) TaxID=1381753 RepID=V2Y182_MONRO|nr:hypothetical protein Moror_5923 [Moniliophthora roreri MCA 2997]